jgi:hypothetical protein
MRGYGYIAFRTKLWYNKCWLKIFNNRSTFKGAHMHTSKFFLIVLLAILAGCATGPAPAPYRGGPGYQGQGGYATVQTDVGARTAPCQPFRADELMDWALELDDKRQHSRSAGVNVRKDGSVECSQTESASSSSKGVQAPQPRRAEQPPAKQVEPKKEQPEVTPKSQPTKGVRV